MTMASSPPGDAGAVRSLWRYPVKSMLGEELQTASVTDGGLIGDRAYAILDESTGKVASAKHPRKWGRLLDFRATFLEPPRVGEPLPAVRITLPDGRMVSSAQNDLHALLSGVLERQVVLTATRPASPSVESERVGAVDPADAIGDVGQFMMPGRFSDYAAVHVLATATLDRLQGRYPRGSFDVRRFRPNVVVDSPRGQPPFVENDWVGRTLAIGPEVRLRITDPMPRCVIITLPQDGLPREPGILQGVAEHNQVAIPILGGASRPSAGVCAFVLEGGTIRRGDAVRIE